MTRKRQLGKMIQQEQNRLPMSPSPRVQESIRRVIQALHSQLQTLEQEIDDFFRQHPLWMKKEELLRRVPGVGPQTSLSLVAWL